MEENDFLETEKTFKIMLDQKRQYFNSTKTLILNTIIRLESSFSEAFTQIEKLLSIIQTHRQLITNNLFIRLNNAIKFMDSYYEKLQYVEKDFLYKEKKFIKDQSILLPSYTINDICLFDQNIISCSSEIERNLMSQNIILQGNQFGVNCIKNYNNLLLSGGDDNLIRIYNNQYQCIKILYGHFSSILSIEICQNDLIATGSIDGTIIIWDNNFNQIKKLFHTKLLSLSWSYESYLACGGKKSISIWKNINDHQTKENISIKNKARSLEFAQNLKFFAISQKKCLYIYQYYMDNFQIYQRLQEHQANINCIKFNKSFIISGSDDCQLKLYSQSIKGYYICYQNIILQYPVNAIVVNNNEDSIWLDQLNEIVKYVRV